MQTLTALAPTTPAPMKLLAALLLLSAAAPAIAQSADDVAEPALRAELVDRLATDQEVRQRVIDSGYPAVVDTALVAQVAAVDAENTAWIVGVVDRYGWPTRALVGAEGVNAAFLLVQHADASPDVQARMLPFIERAYRAGDIPGQGYAMLLDRVLVGRGEPQVYGTQAAFGADGEIALSPTADEGALDARRAEVGLPPAAEYLDMLRQVYQAAPSGE